MDAQEDPTLLERLERLEKDLRELRQLVSTALADKRPPDASGEAPSGPDLRGPRRARAPEAGSSGAATFEPASGFSSAVRSNLQAAFGQGESWLGRVGIALTLLGLIFVFKYSVDQGWLTPPVRVAFGLVLGAFLLAAGIRIRARRRHLSQLLMGGSIATFFISAYAAYQFYALVPYVAAFAFMIAVVILAFSLSLLETRALLSLVGTLGALVTPFLLYGGSRSVGAFGTYVCTVLVGAAAVYAHRGWRSLLWTAFVGGWIVLALSLTLGLFVPYPLEASIDRWTFQACVLVAWALFWILPLAREMLASAAPHRWPQPSLEPLAPFLSPRTLRLAERHIFLLSVLTPLVALALSTLIWPLSSGAWGTLVLMGAAVYGIAGALVSYLASQRDLARAQAVAALILLTLGLVLVLDGDPLLVALALEAGALHWVARRTLESGVSLGGHLLFLGLAPFLLFQLLSDASGIPGFNSPALSDVIVILTAATVASFVRPPRAASVYRLGAHAGLLLWLWRELSALPNGAGYVTVAWGAYAVILLLLALRLDRTWLRTLAMATLFLVVGKLLLFDLQTVEAIWRILLFLGFGGLFLVLSYLYRSLWSPAERPAKPE